MKVMPAVVLAALVPALLIVLAAPVHADTHVKTLSHVDSHYRGGQVNPAEDTEREMWIGEDRLAYVTGSWTIVVDLSRQSFTFINPSDSTFVESPLPLDLSRVFSEGENARLTMFKRRGTVEKTAETKSIDSRACTAYKANDWMIYDDSKLYERDVVMWITTEVPFDCRAFAEMRVVLEQIGNLGDDYIELRRGIEGFQLAADETMYVEGIPIKTTMSVTEFSEQDPPEGIYAVPEGFVKKDLLTLAEVRS